MQRDEEARRRSARMRGTALGPRECGRRALLHRWRTPSCAMGVPIGRETTPRLYGLMGRMLIDVGLSTYRAQNRYQRRRPFVVHPGADLRSRRRGGVAQRRTYPSGHSALGWGWGLVLAEVDPERTDAMLQRAREFGESRMVATCAGRATSTRGGVIAAATVARFHADPAFRAISTPLAAKSPAARQAGRRPTRDCAAEAASLAMPSPAGFAVARVASCGIR